jgi:hypothetical protein
MKRHLVQSAASLVPLHIAVRMVYAAVYHQRSNEAANHERLGGLAQVMIGIIPVYTVPAGETEPLRIPESQLAGGQLRLGGKEMQFTGGQAAIRSVLVSRTGIDHVIKLLRAAPDQDERPMQEEAPPGPTN